MINQGYIVAEGGEERAHSLPEKPLWKDTWRNNFFAPFQEDPWMGEDLPLRLLALLWGNPAESYEANRETQSVQFLSVAQWWYGPIFWPWVMDPWSNGKLYKKTEWTNIVATIMVFP